ncbi:hypothetical protein TVAG_059050 [Trichomonas vaginalis G3]|uniref:Uncharacterized protein n=1 Tax=Trichomonas vaginalis (strain ATCC PRA-98 / G3) TaxID=412133 RepID=A2ERI0_TRIV3|nr:hypothetical protein TVAGG3_0284700 [Trichomonas vaginalis G3]EAY04707.1 hypothetical protein TVAG_059050 [Trichomonas vaginalis G3]KAI5526805.1 hypothetical protein TVAGG3_0284700 [Trichomonas vaginalis G3]|eukprot:XP_001316930.1 hypothetical protein [Trichomonas vaginalis G3]
MSGLPGPEPPQKPLGAQFNPQILQVMRYISSINLNPDKKELLLRQMLGNQQTAVPTPVQMPGAPLVQIQNPIIPPKPNKISNPQIQKDIPKTSPITSEPTLNINSNDSADDAVCSLINFNSFQKQKNKVLYELSGVGYIDKSKLRRNSSFEQGHFVYEQEDFDQSTYFSYFFDDEPTHRVDKSKLKTMDPSIRTMQNWKSGCKSYLIDPDPRPFKSPRNDFTDYVCNTNYKSACLGDEGQTAYPPRDNAPIEAQAPQLEMNVMTDELTIDHLKLLAAMNDAAKKYIRGQLPNEVIENLAETRNEYKRNLHQAMGDTSFVYRPLISPQTTSFDQLDFPSISLHDFAYYSYLTYILELNGPILPKNQLSISIGLAKLIPLIREAVKRQDLEFHLVCPNSCLAFLYYVSQLFTTLSNLEDYPRVIPLHASFDVFKRFCHDSHMIITTRELKMFLEWIELGGSISHPIYQARNASLGMIIHKEEYFQIATEWLSQKLSEEVLIQRALSISQGKSLFGVNFMVDEVDNVLIIVTPINQWQRRQPPKIIPSFFPFSDNYWPEGDPGEPNPSRALIHESSNLEFKLTDGKEMLKFKPGTSWFMFNLAQQMN